MDSFIVIISMIGVIASVTFIAETLVHHNLLDKEDKFNG
jgi:hypothetical protein